MHESREWSASHTREGNWSRLISFAKEPAHAVVFDFAHADGAAHWQFVSDPPPVWQRDWVELTRHGRRLQVHYPNHLGWYQVRHWDDGRVGDRNARNDVWAADDPARRLTLSAARTWAVALLPVRAKEVAVTATNPTGNGRPQYPAAAGVKVEGADAIDWHGARRGNRTLRYDAVTTDAEAFWARRAGLDWTICSANASQVCVPLPQKPAKVILDGVPLVEAREWAYADGVLTYTTQRRSGKLQVAARQDGK